MSFVKKGKVSKLFSEIVQFIRELGVRFTVYLIAFSLIMIFGLFALNDFGINVLSILLADIGLDYYLENTIIIKKQRSKCSCDEFDESSYDLYCQINKMRLSLILKVVLLCFTVVKYISNIDLPMYSDKLLSTFSKATWVYLGLIIFVTFLVGIVASFIIMIGTQQDITQIVEDLYKESEHNFIKNPNNKKENTNEETT